MINDLEAFALKFKARYGQNSMNDATTSMWFEKLMDMDNDHFVKVIDELIGSRDRVFGWRVVIEKHDIMFPSKDAQKALDDVSKWKFDSESSPNKDKKLIHSQILRRIPMMVKNNPKGWRYDYFTKVYDLFGEIECMEIALKIQFQFPDFKDWLYQKTKVKK